MSLPGPSITSPESIADRRIAYQEVDSFVPSLRYFLFRPSTEKEGRPLVVSVHGIARNAAAHAYRLAAHAEQHGVCILAPLFERDAYGQYQQLVDKTTGARSDLALLAMIDDAGRKCGADVSKSLLFGYSGGAQFCHRFAMAHPHRVASAVIASAGWYTLPIVDAPYPYGLKASEAHAGIDLDPAAFAKVPFHVLVGELDTERDGSLRRSRLLDVTQGETRVGRARTWVNAMSRLASALGAGKAPTLSVMTGVGHSFNECIERADLSKMIFAHFSADVALTASEFN